MNEERSCSVRLINFKKNGVIYPSYCLKDISQAIRSSTILLWFLYVTRKVTWRTILDFICSRHSSKVKKRFRRKPRFSNQSIFVCLLLRSEGILAGVIMMWCPSTVPWRQFRSWIVLSNLIVRLSFLTHVLLDFIDLGHFSRGIESYSKMCAVGNLKIWHGLTHLHFSIPWRRYLSDADDVRNVLLAGKKYPKRVAFERMRQSNFCHYFEKMINLLRRVISL